MGEADGTKTSAGESLLASSSATADDNDGDSEGSNAGDEVFATTKGASVNGLFVTGTDEGPLLGTLIIVGIETGDVGDFPKGAMVFGGRVFSDGAEVVGSIVGAGDG